MADYTRIYEGAYARGYHSDPMYTHSIPLLEQCLTTCTAGIRNAIDFGASKGAAVRWLQSKGVTATGIEISKFAVDEAAKMKTNLIRGSISDRQNFQDNSFDLVFSTDVMEHLEPNDVSLCVREQVRISRMYVAAKISTKKANVLRPFEHMGVDFNPHLTVRSFRWWLDVYVSAGLRIIWTNGKDSVIFKKVVKANDIGDEVERMSDIPEQDRPAIQSRMKELIGRELEPDERLPDPRDFVVGRAGDNRRGKPMPESQVKQIRQSKRERFNRDCCIRKLQNN